MASPRSRPIWPAAWGDPPSSARSTHSLRRSRGIERASSHAGRCNGKGPADAGPFLNVRRDRSALAELEAAAGLGLAVLLALDLAVVAGQEATGLEQGAQRRL